MIRNYTLTFFVLFVFQVNSIFAQCSTGSEPDCTCGTAPVLCSVDELDNYSFSMSSFSHPQDAPSPICPGVNGSVSNNPTWFAFTAWCTDLTLNMSVSNCTSVGSFIGVQVAIYPDCNLTNAVACNAAVNDCNTNDKQLSMTGLTIGGVYYFLVDGCAGSACDVTIDVVGVCGAEQILPWTQGITGEINPCAGNTENYSVENLVGAAQYHWYVDNVLINTTNNPNFNYTWLTAGTYQLCVDASNDPCVPESDPPPPLCTTITVYDSEAGVLTVMPSPLCPGEIANITVTGFNAGPDNAQAILITDAAGLIVEVISGSSGTFTSPVCGVFTVYSYNYIPAIGTVPTVGLDVNTIDCLAECCDLEMMPLSFEDTQLPTFPNPPASITLDCNDLVPPLSDLDWNDNCDGTGMVAGMETGSADNCNGGTLERTWEYMDGCGNTANYVQTITINPTPAPTFDMLPGNQTVDCNSIPTAGVDLTYTNNGLGACLISGSVTPTQSGSADICGGMITYDWNFTDICGNTITHTQTITVTPADPPAFINPPPTAVTVDCENIPTGAPDLMYTNNGIGNCLISGSAVATVAGSADLCGGAIEYTWSATNPCGAVVTHIQRITVTPAPDPAYVNPPASMTVDCENIPTGAPDLMYTNNGLGGCLMEGMTAPVQSGTADLCGGTITYTWDDTDPCGNPLSHSQDITVTPAPPPTFTNLPMNMTVSCDNIPTSAPDLNFSNNGIGGCLIQGVVQAVRSGTGDICGGTIDFTWDFLDVCGNPLNHVQTITITPAAPPTFINPPGNQTISCDAIPNGAPDLFYSNNETGDCEIAGSVSAVEGGSADVCGGTITYTWDYTDICDNSIQHIQEYQVDPAPPAVFTSPLPADITVNCDAVPTIPPGLNYTNSLGGVCEISGTQSAVQIGTYTACGGQFQFRWEFTDPCGRVLSHEQNVTVNPAPTASFINPPGPISVACSAVATTPPTLNYTNGQNGLCSISGSVQAIQSGSYDPCGGTITYTFVFTDPCNRTITHSQNVTVLPASDPIFVNPPADITIACGLPFPDPYDLTYSNSELGDCEIMGMVLSNVTVSGLVATYNWFWTNPCNNATITHTQAITQTAEPLLVVNPTNVTICEGESFDLNSISIIDQNNTNPNITFHSGSPANPGNQIPSTIVSPSTSTTYYILGSNNSGCSNETSFDVIVEPPPFPGNNGTGAICFLEAGSVNFFDYLLGNPDQSGFWQDTYFYGVDVSNPFSVDLSGLAPGVYTFDYFLPSGGVCPDAMASIILTVLEEIFIEVSGISCSTGGSTYEVTINTFGFEIFPFNGTVIDLGGGLVLVSDIPIGTLLLISYTNPGFPLCEQFFPVVSPDCDCPNVDPPMSNGDAQICEGETNPELSVTVGTDETANWYDAPSGGTLLIGGSSTFTPTETAPGVYTYYVQTENTVDGCVSSILTQVVFEISANPVGVNASLTNCDIDGTGFTSFDLTTANGMISADPTNSYTYYLTFADATNEINPLPNNYTNTSTPSQTIYVVITSAAGCTAIVELTLNVSPLPNITLDIEDETCSAEGDGSVTINAANATTFSLNGTDWLGTNTFDSLAAGSYTAYAQDALGCIGTLPFNIAEGLMLTVSTFEIACDNNGTASDASDDFYTITFSVTNNQGNVGSYTLNDGTTDLGIYNYNQSNTLTIPAAGQSLTLLFTDDLLPCSVSQAVGPLTSCSTDCTITIDLLTFDCSDNGTSSDASDDFYTITINASAINGASNGTYNVLVNSVLNFNYPYNTVSTFTLPADVTSPVITVVDNQDAQCQASQSIGPLTTCSDACVIDIVELMFTCNDNGTLTDPSDDFYTITISSSAVNPGTSNSFEVFANSVSQGTFDYITGGSFTLPADGSAVTIRVEDSDDTGCFAEQSIGVLDPCDEDCTIMASVSNIVCDDNDTPTDPTDDSFTFEVFVSGQNTAVTWQSIDGTLTGSYSINESFGPYPISGGNLNFDLQDMITPSCQTSISVTAPPTCSDACILNIDLLDFVCDDNGTLTDPLDDFYTITINASAINPGASNLFEVFANSISQGTYDYVNGASFTLPADGMNMTIRVEDTEITSCFAEQSIGVLASCDEDCTISATVSNIVCDDNGTGNDNSDDTFTFDVFVSGQNIGATWQSTDLSLSGNYGMNENFGPFPISGGTLNFSLQDITTANCQTPITIDPPQACSDPCVASIDLLDFVCDDNGTLTDPSDDFYNITIDASAVNPGASNSFEVFANNVSQGTFDYANTVSFTLPADGATMTIRIEDADFPGCFAEQSIGVLASCDEDCMISATVSNIVCDDNGTGNDNSDDTFTFDVFVSGQNIGATWQSTDLSLSGNYGMNENFGPFPISGGALNFSLQDITTASCQTPITINPPQACSDPCVASIDLLDFVCDDNGTLTDPSDDFYNITIDASAVNPGASNSFEIFANNVSQGTFDYANTVSFTLPADGATMTIRIEDADFPGCFAEQSIGVLASCDEDCTISATVSNIVCDDNGTGNDNSDDTFTFDVFVSGQNIGATWQSTDLSLSGNYGMNENFGPFPISGGALNFSLQDITTASCQTPITINPPQACSDPCVASIDLLDFVCDDNGTLTDPSDDFYNITIDASAVNPGASNSFEIFANNVSQGTFDYANTVNFTLPADGATMTIRIEDADFSGCFAEQSIGVLASCDEDCTISATVSNIVCDDNGTGNDNSDDTFTFDVFVSGQNTGATWQSTDLSLSGNYGMNENFGPFPISGGTLNFSLQDITTATCQTPITINPPMTCSNCGQSVDAGVTSIITCDNPFADLIGTSSEVGTYEWTGPNGFSSINLVDSTNISGWYYLTGTYALNCSAIDSVFIDLSTDLPTADAGPDLMITCLMMNVTLDGSQSMGSNLTYSWFDSDMNFLSDQIQYTTSQSDTFTLEITDQLTGCTHTDFAIVTINQTTPQAIIYADPDNILNCRILSITLTSDPQPNVIYSWNNITAPMFVIDQPGTVDLIVIDTISGCQNSSTIEITDLEDYPLVNLDAANPLSCYDEEIVINGSSSQTGAGIIYEWYDSFGNLIQGENGNSITVDQSGFYILQLTDTLNFCTNSDTVFVDELFTTPLAQNVADQTLYCGVSQTTLDLELFGPLNEVEITWSSENGDILSGDNTLNPQVQGSGVYTVEVLNILSGCTIEDSLVVNLDNDYPTFLQADLSDENCIGFNNGSINITEVMGGAEPLAFNLNGTITNDNSFENLSPGFYNLQITDDNGCQLDSSFVIEPGVDLELDMPLQLELVQDQLGTIAATINVPEDQLSSIQWTPPGLLSCDDCLVTTIRAVDNQIFQLIIVHENGCVAIGELRLIVRDRASIYIPNAFSPNGDGFNDFFTIFANEEIEEIESMSIFDRWGEHVFQGNNFPPNDLNFGWDGRLRGKDMNPAVFVYMVTVKFKDGRSEVYSGDLTLMR